MNEQKTREVSDLSLASYLSLQGHKLLKVRGNGFKAFFIFPDTPKLEEDTLAYYNRVGTICALDFAEQLRNYKSLAVANRYEKGERDNETPNHPPRHR